MRAKVPGENPGGLVRGGSDAATEHGLKVSFKHRLEYALVRALMLPLAVLPERLAYAGVAGLGQLFFLCSRRRQTYALKFLRQAYPEGKTDRELLAIARRATGNFVKIGLDMMRVHRVLEQGRFADAVEGLDTLRQRLPEGPVLVVSGHLGSWEVGAIALAQARDEAHVLVRIFKNPLLQDFIERTRSRAGLHLHGRRGGLRGLARALKRGAVGIQAIDQNQRLRGVFVPFFGKLASTERAAATLAVREGYPVAICYSPRVGKGFRFKAVVQTTIHPERPQSKEDVPALVEDLVRKINAGLEEAILAHPEQYLWIHDRYRTQPKQGEQDGEVAVAVDESLSRAVPADG